jgi:hypothetical protein
MPAWNLAGSDLAVPPEAALVLWGLCAVFGLLLTGALTAFALELRSLFRESGRPLPGSEFQGFGRAAPRIRV